MNAYDRTPVSTPSSRHVPPRRTPAEGEPTHGWYHIAFASEIGASEIGASKVGASKVGASKVGASKVGASEVADGISSFAVGGRRLILVRQDGAIRCFGADCPHRGAHLGVAGRLVPGGIVCGFHGYRLAMKAEAGTPLCLTEYRTAMAGTSVLVRLSDGFDFGLEARLAEIAEDHAMVEGLHLRGIRTSMRLVIENGFDARHFDGVHRIRVRAFSAARLDDGPLRAEATFVTPLRPLVEGGAPRESAVAYEGTAFSPGLIIVRLGGEAPYGVMTGATDNGDGTCDIRLTFILPKSAYGTSPDPSSYAFLKRYSETGLGDDIAIWESIAPGFSGHAMPEDRPIEAFHDFCAGFG